MRASWDLVFLLKLYCLPEIFRLFQHTEEVIDYFPETCGENMIFLCSATWACISCLQIVICWQGLCHDTTHLSLQSAVGEQPLFFFPSLSLSDGLKSAAASTLSPSALTPPSASSLDVINKCSRSRWQRLLDSEYSTFDKLPSRLFLLSCQLLRFVVFLPPPAFGRDAWRWDQTWSRGGKWNVVIEEKVQIGSSCKWSLVSGGRFLFTR